MISNYGVCHNLMIEGALLINKKSIGHHSGFQFEITSAGCKTAAAAAEEEDEQSAELKPEDGGCS